MIKSLMQPVAAQIRPTGQSLAIVIFGPSTLSVLRLLHPAYRHCMIAMQDQGQWHLLDPRSNALDIIALGTSYPREIIASFQGCGYEAIAVQRRAPRARLSPVFPFTCVEVVKRALGMHAPLIFTPRQLRDSLLS